MRDYSQWLVKQIQMHQKKHIKLYYYEMQVKDFVTDLERAGRFLYLIQMY